MIKFFYQKYEHKKFWSHKTQKYYISSDISDQVWDSPEQPCKGELLDMHSILRILPKTNNKTERSAIMRFDGVTEFPLKEYVGYDKWNGIIFIDLDLNKSKIFNSRINTPEKINKFYDAIKEVIYNLAPCNFYMIEHSSSGIGLHILFYFDVEKTEENFFKCAEWSRKLLTTKIICDEYDILDDFSSMIVEDKVFDPIYNRPYQKCFITGIDAYTNDFATGEFDISSISLENKRIKTNKDHSAKTTYEIESIRINKNTKFDTDHNDRFYLYTALKKATQSEEELNKYWYKLCPHFLTYKQYTLNKFLKEFDYKSINAEVGNINLLKKYGIKINEENHHIDLGNGYLGDKRDIILSLLKTGINFMKASTGSGKTKVWIDYNIELLRDLLNLHKPILIIEPLNSIIETKYDDKATTITGAKKFPKLLTSYGMYVTNFNKLLRKVDSDTWCIREDIDDLLSQFGLIIIDESHILIKDAFRCNVLIPFIKSINKAAKQNIIIFQTATPMHEDILFDIKNRIICHKESNIDTKWIFRRCQNDRFEISQLTCLVNYYVQNGRKVYIYWNNASLSQLKAFKATYTCPDRVAIFHKRNTGEESMNRIATYHRLKTDNYEYDVLLSSVYFGVGNDLDDEVNAAVIIIGNNSWQEDIQAVGRWRNSKDVEICQIILPNEYEFIKETAANKKTFLTIKSNETKKLNNMWLDKLNKNKSVIIGHKAYRITQFDDIDYLATMSAADIYNSQFSVKIEMLQDSYYNFRVKEDFNKILECNEDFTNTNKNYWDSVRDERNKNKQNIMKGTIDWEIINKDTKLNKFKQLWDKCKAFGIDKLLGPKYISQSTHYHLLNCWIKYYIALSTDNIDYPEIYALLWFRNNYDKNKAKDIMKIKKIEFELTKGEWLEFLAYIIFIHYKNKDSKDYNLYSNYIIDFKYNCRHFVDMPKALIDMFYKNNENIANANQTKIFFSDLNLKDEEFETTIISNIEDILAQTERMNKEKTQIKKLFNMFFNNQRVGGKIGGKKSSPKKPVIITNKFEKLEKYKLKEGDEFESCGSLAKYANVSTKCVTEWLKKKWVIKK